MGKYKYTCPNCHNEFSSNNKGRKFCSRRCFNESQTRYSVIKVCKHCGKTYSTRYDNQQFCSKKCRGEASRTGAEVKCDNCGKQLYVAPNILKRSETHFCSIECKRAYFGWNEEDVKTLQENFGKIKVADLALLFTKEYSYSSIRDKATRMGLVTSTRWTEGEHQILVENYSDKPIEEVMAMLPGRTYEAIKTHAVLHKVKKYERISSTYTVDEIKFIYDNHDVLYLDEIAERLRRNENGLRQKMRLLGLTCKIKEGRKYFGSDGGLRLYVRNHLNHWKDKKLKELGGKCCLTGSVEDLVVHHCYAFNILLEKTIDALNFEVKDSFAQYSKEALDEFVDTFKIIQDYHDECACVTKSIHLLFHRDYGFGDNTPEQWNEFVEKFKAGQYADIA